MMPIATTPMISAFRAGIGHEGRLDLLVQHKDEQSDQDDEHKHPDQKDARRRKLERIEFLGHEFRNTSTQPCRTLWHRPVTGKKQLSWWNYTTALSH